MKLRALIVKPAVSDEGWPDVAFGGEKPPRKRRRVWL